MSSKCEIRERNVPDVQDAKGNWLKSYRPKPNHECFTRSGLLWNRINTRSKDAYKSMAKTYELTENLFVDFQEFASWCQNEQGYYLKDGKRFWQLDKDLLVKGNKCYSKDTCMFVPSEINCLMNSSKPNGYMIGVSVNLEKPNEYYSYCGNTFGGIRHLGKFKSEFEAHRNWQTAKILQVEFLIQKYRDFVKIQIALSKIHEQLSNDIKFNRETVI